MPAISPADSVRLQSHLRRTLHSPGLSLADPAMRGGAVEVRLNGDVLGTIDQVDEEGERSWAVTLIVLEEDLA